MRNISPGDSGIVVVPVVLSGQRSATAAAVVRFKTPSDATLLDVQSSARASGGSSPTLDVDVQEGGVTLLTAPMSVAAGAVTEGVVSDKLIAKGAEITVDIAIGGTSPTWDDINVLMILKLR